MKSHARDDAGGVVYDVAPDCTLDDLEPGVAYRATVNGVVDYGVFVDLSPGISGLVHESSLDGTHEVGDDLLVELDEVRENGDVAFVPSTVDPDGATVRTVFGAADPTPINELGGRVGDTVTVEGEVVQIRQTAGPTIFRVSDGGRIASCAAFAEDGRAHPETERDDIVRATGTVERHDGRLQVEVDSLLALSGDRESEARDRIADRLTDRAQPGDPDPIVEWEPLERLRPELRRVATELRRAVLTGRPIRMRHHADGDGMCAAVPVQRAIEAFVADVYPDPEAGRHFLKRLPTKAPFYEMEDATRDLTYALRDGDRHGQKFPLLLMLDNGSTAEDVPAYETLANYDTPIVVVDHHHPDPDAVGPLLTEHVNPYLHGDDYRVTTGMMCVELARMIHPSVVGELQHVPAAAALADRSEADAVEEYVAAAEAVGYDRSDLRDVGEALDYAAHHLRYDAGRHMIDDLLNVGCDDPERHRHLVSLFAEQSRDAVNRQLDAAMDHVESERLDNGSHLYRIDVDEHAHRFVYPAPGTTTGAIHDRMVEETGEPVITIGYGPDFAVLRSDGVRLDIPEMVEQLKAEVDGGGVSGGGHLVVGSVKFVRGMRETVIDALVEKMADAEIDEDLGSSAAFVEDAE
ncbi:RecJ like exonuclease [Halobacteriales archaeon SW_7_68_16]|nr:MAG: RecJ like exonuclease [Halobacteriales archaeon SW_7_68_16]